MLDFVINALEALKLRFRQAYWRKKLALMAKGVWFQDAVRVDGAERIFLHEDSVVQHGSWIAAVPLTGGAARLEIGRRTVLGRYSHIYAVSSIVIEDDVLLADKVYVSDCAHSYEDVTTPILRQPIRQLSEIRIGAGAWLGENVCVMGASVGRHSVIGANSVVLRDIPDYCVAVGVPARVVKRYDFTKKEWLHV